jgi:hypothetical protein
MDVDTKFLRLRKQTALGDYIGGWRVCWLGGWSRDQLFYMVMVVRAKAGPNSARVMFRAARMSRANFGEHEKQSYSVPVGKDFTGTRSH